MNSSTQALPVLSDTDTADDTAVSMNFYWPASSEAAFDEAAEAFREIGYEVRCDGKQSSAR